MKLALECPTPLLKHIQPLTDYDFILAHLVLQDTKYADYYRNSKRYKILDNSCNELLQPMSVKDIKKADEVLGGCDLVVAPDFLGNAFKTADSLRDMLKVFNKSRVLPVIQGGTPYQANQCAQAYHQLGFHYMALPFDISLDRTYSLGEMSIARTAVLSGLVGTFGDQVDYHLLGMTTVEELQDYAEMGKFRDRIRTVDTGAPVLLGLKGMQIDKHPLESKSTPTYNQMKDLGEGNLESVYYNIAYLRKVLHGA